MHGQRQHEDDSTPRESGNGDARWPRRPAVTADEARAFGEQELFERLEQLLVETRGNIAEIGRRMGKDRSTIRYHLRRFGMLGQGARRSEESARREGGEADAPKQCPETRA